MAFGGVSLASPVPYGVDAAVGDYIASHYVARTTGGLTANSEYLSPIWLANAMTFDKISAEVTTLDAAALLRLGIRAHDPSTMRPGTLVVDAGTVGCGTAQVVEITINQRLSSGLYWLSCTAQNGPTTLAVRRINTTVWVPPTPDAAVATRAFGATPPLGYESTAAGALPSSPTILSTPPIVMPLVALRRSA